MDHSHARHDSHAHRDSHAYRDSHARHDYAHRDPAWRDGGWTRTSYRNRTEAGAVLAERLSGYAGRADVIVLGLVRGGVPVADVVAGRLGAPLDVLVVRKLGVPGAPELAFGALGSGGVMVLNQGIAARLDPAQIASVRHLEQAELHRREARYRGDRAPLRLDGTTAIIVDDGLATGATARAAVAVARALGAARVVLAVPVGAPEAVDALAGSADEVVCPLVPHAFSAVSRHYDQFPQVHDDEVLDYLKPAPH